MPATPSPFSPTAMLDLLIPFAACSGPAWAEAMKALPPGSLLHLGKLLQGMKLVHTDTGSAHSLTPPHERALARSLGLAGDATPDGLVPWAAREAATLGPSFPAGKAWAFVTPCHWSMGREHATLTDPAALALTEDDARTLLAAMQPYFETEGITLHYAGPQRWLAEGELLRDLPTASLDRVLGRNVDAWLPATSTAPSLRRLQNEMQMLLYTHEVNDRRGMARQLPVNSFWLSGSGALAEDFQPSTSHAPPVPRSLAQAAFTDSWEAYADAWKALDAGEITALLARQRAGETVRLALCGESNTCIYESAAPSLGARIKSLFSPVRPLDVLATL